MNFKFSKKFLAAWAVVWPIVVFLIGPGGFLWRLDESKARSAQLNLETIRVVADLRGKMTQITEELGKPESDQRLRQAKIDNFNAFEKQLAPLEGRSPNFFVLKPPPKPILKVE